MTNEVPVEKLVKVYIKMREKHAELSSAFKEQEEALKDIMLLRLVFKQQNNRKEIVLLQLVLTVELIRKA